MTLCLCISLSLPQIPAPALVPGSGGQSCPGWRVAGPGLVVSDASPGWGPRPATPHYQAECNAISPLDSAESQASAGQKMGRKLFWGPPCPLLGWQIPEAPKLLAHSERYSWSKQINLAGVLVCGVLEQASGNEWVFSQAAPAAHAVPPPAASPSWAFFSSSLCFLFSINTIHANPAGPVTAQGQLYFSAVNPGPLLKLWP